MKPAQTPPPPQGSYMLGSVARISANSYANHLAERSHLHGPPGGPMSHGKSECESRGRGGGFADAPAPAGLHPDVFVGIFFRVPFDLLC